MLRWQSPGFASPRRGAVTSQITATHRGPSSCSSGGSGRHGHARSRLLQLMTIPSRQALPLPPAESGAQIGR